MMFIKSNCTLATTLAVLMLASQAVNSDTDPEQSERFKSSVMYGEFRTTTSSYKLRASDIIGAEVVNASDEEIGEVDDLVLERDSDTVMAVISVGGFLGIGDKLVTVPYEDLRLSEDGNEVFLSTTKEILESRDEFRYNDGELIGRDVMSTRISRADLQSKWDDIEQGWDDFKSSVKQQWSELTDDDIDEIGGDRDRLVDRLGQRYDIDADEAGRQVDEWHDNSTIN